MHLIQNEKNHLRRCFVLWLKKRSVAETLTAQTLHSTFGAASWLLVPLLRRNTLVHMKRAHHTIATADDVFTNFREYFAKVSDSKRMPEKCLQVMSRFVPCLHWWKFVDVPDDLTELTRARGIPVRDFHILRCSRQSFGGQNRIWNLTYFEGHWTQESKGYPKIL